MLTLLISLLTLPTAYAATDKADFAPHYATMFTKAMNGQATGVHQFDQLGKEKDIAGLVKRWHGVKSASLRANDGNICINSFLAQTCWAVTEQNGQVKVEFEGENGKAVFTPSNPLNLQATAAEFRKFASKQKKRSALWRWFSLESTAFAEDSGSIIKKMDSLKAGSRSWADPVAENFPGLVAASAKGWSYLPEKPTQKEQELLAFYASERFKPYLTKAGKLPCNTYVTNFARVDGKTAQLRLEEKGFSLKVFPAGAGTKGEPESVHKLGFVRPYSTESCSNYLIYSTCEYSTPYKVLNIATCGSKDGKKDCKEVDVYHHDYDQDYVFRALEAATNVFGNGESSFAKLHKAREDYEAKKISWDTYWAKYLDAYTEIQDKYHQGMDAMQDRMMRLAELKKACESPHFREKLKDGLGHLEIDNSPAENANGTDAQ